MRLSRRKIDSKTFFDSVKNFGEITWFLSYRHPKFAEKHVFWIGRRSDLFLLYISSPQKTFKMSFFWNLDRYPVEAKRSKSVRFHKKKIIFQSFLRVTEAFRISVLS